MNRTTITLLSCLAVLGACSNPEVKSTPGGEPANGTYSLELPLDQLKLPDGFKIDIYAEVNNARGMALSPDGILYVGNNLEEGSVYAVRDVDGDYKADKRWTIDTDLNMPTGVAFQDGDLYVSAISRILKYNNIEDSLDASPEPVVINDSYPTETHHGWKYIAFGPDGKLYVPVGAPCNMCDPEDEIYASITRINPDGSGREIVAHGIRNTVGFTWHPKTGHLWFTDNNRDMMGDDMPSCELNVAKEMGLHFGYPYCHQGDTLDPEFGAGHTCSEFVPPVSKLGAHVAPLGLKFYTGTAFPAEYQGQLFVAEHGSWNRSKKTGYNVTLVSLNEDETEKDHTVFISGWLNEETQEAWGRPVDVLELPDGSILISDDKANVIYRVSYPGTK